MSTCDGYNCGKPLTGAFDEWTLRAEGTDDEPELGFCSTTCLRTYVDDIFVGAPR